MKTVRRWPPLSPLLFVSLMFACGGNEPAREGGAGSSAAPSSSAPTSAGASALVPPDAVRQCAHFSAANAAEVLGVPAAEIEVTSEDIHATLRGCGYVRKGTARGVSFALATNETVEEAREGMTSGREAGGMARRSIDGVTGKSSAGPSVEEVAGIGDEAYWMAVNGTLNVRVKNIEVQIISPNDREKQKEVARKIVEGLSH